MANEKPRDIIKEILGSFKSEEEYEKTNLTPIKRDFKYRSASGRLFKYETNKPIQTFKSIIKKSNDANMVETGLAMLMERYDTFGPFHQYPKTFFLGPSIDFEKLGSEELRSEERPYIRDIDRILIVLKDSNQKDFSLIVVDFFHDRFIPNEITYEYLFFPYHKVNVEITNQKIKKYINFIFKDTAEYTLNYIESKYERKETTFIFKSSESNSFLKVLDIADKASLERYIDPEKFIQEEKSINGNLSLTENLVLASLLIGHNGFVVPSDPTQKDHPVPLGLINLDKLDRIRNVFIVRKSTNETFSTPSKSPYDYLFSKSETGEEEEEEKDQPSAFKDDITSRIDCELIRLSEDELLFANKFNDDE